MTPILSRVQWSELLRKVRTETKNREVHQPLVSVYRWWARRPHSLIGGLLEAAAPSLEPTALIADPFSGGGTVAVEAMRRSMNVYAQDVNPWASWGLKISATPVDSEALEAAGNKFLARLRERFGSAYACAASRSRSVTHVHTFRVRSVICSSCGKSVWMFPYSLLTVASRRQGEADGFFGCRACGAVTRARLNRRDACCPVCDSNSEDGSRDGCPHCGELLPVTLDQQPPVWAIVLVQRRIEEGERSWIEFDQARDSDLAVIAKSQTVEAPISLSHDIPLGIETAKLLRFGFRSWADLYPLRQLSVLISARDELDSLDVENKIRDRLMLCVAGAGEMPGHVCRWDRFHPKIFEGLANHRFSFDGLAVEPNPLAVVGRGSLAHRIAASVSAARWLSRNVIPKPRVSYLKGSRGKRLAVDTASDVVVVLGSSEHLRLEDSSVSLILTDPPYFGCVRYGELSSLLLAWTPVLGIARRAGRFDSAKEAVPNGNSSGGEVKYRRQLTGILSECARVLKSNGRLIMTYHSRSLLAWSALGRAIADGGFSITALAVAETENGRDHAKRGKMSFVTDLLLECIRTNGIEPVTVHTKPRNPEERELLHAGLAIAEVRNGTYEQLRAVFLRRVTRMRERKILAPHRQVWTTST
jgi:hypothetical protein